MTRRGSKQVNLRLPTIAPAGGLHATRLPRDVMWYADPAGARKITELFCAGFTIQKGDNEQRPGIAAVRARLEHGKLKILAGACPNLLAEASLYH